MNACFALSVSGRMFEADGTVLTVKTRGKGCQRAVDKKGPSSVTEESRNVQGRRKENNKVQVGGKRKPLGAIEGPPAVTRIRPTDKKARPVQWNDKK